MENSNVDAGGAGASTRGNAKRLSEVIADAFFWCYLEPWQGSGQMQEYVYNIMSQVKLSKVYSVQYRVQCKNIVKLKL